MFWENERSKANPRSAFNKLYINDFFKTGAKVIFNKNK